MADQKLIDYLKEGIKKGYSEVVLKDNLVNEGWDSEDVDEALRISSEINNPRSVSKVETNGPFQPVQTKQAIEDKKGSRPVGVTIISILHWLMAFSIIAQAVYQLIFNNSIFGGMLPALITGTLYTVAIAFTGAIAFFPFFVGLGIWKGQNGWRIVAIIIGCIVVFFGLLSLLRPTILGVVSLVILGYIPFYLMFSKKGKAYFKED